MKLVLAFWIGLLGSLSALAADPVIYQFPNGSELRLNTEGSVFFIPGSTVNDPEPWKLPGVQYIEATAEAFERVKNSNPFPSELFVVPGPSAPFMFLSASDMIYVVDQSGRKFPVYGLQRDLFKRNKIINTDFKPIVHNGKTYRAFVVTGQADGNFQQVSDLYLMDENFHVAKWVNLYHSKFTPHKFAFDLKGDQLHVQLLHHTSTAEAVLALGAESIEGTWTVTSPEDIVSEFRMKLAGMQYYKSVAARLSVNEVNENRNTSFTRDIEAKLRALAGWSGSEIPYFTIYQNREYRLIAAFAERAEDLGMPFETSVLMRFEKPVYVPNDSEFENLELERQRLAAANQKTSYFYIVPGDGYARVFYVPAGRSAEIEPIARVGEGNVVELTEETIVASMPQWHLGNSPRVRVPEMIPQGLEQLHEGEYTAEQMEKAEKLFSSELPLVIIKEAFDIRDESFVDEILPAANYALKGAFYVAIPVTGKQGAYTVIRIVAGTTNAGVFKQIMDCGETLEGNPSES